MTEYPPNPARELKRSPCPRCGARTLNQAETRCRPQQDITGDYVCPSGDERDVDSNGYFRVETASFIEKMNAWYDAVGKTESLK